MRRFWSRSAAARRWITHGSVHAFARSVFYAGLAASAWEELVSGVNWVRRALGAAGLFYVVDKVAAALGA